MIKAGSKPPQARREPHDLTVHGETRTDDYYWLRDDSRKSPEVLEYLQAENAYAEEAMRPLMPLRESLYEELKSHIKETDSSAPYKWGPYFYYSRLEEGKEYRIHCRRAAATRAAFDTAPEEVIFDENKEAEGHTTFHLASGLAVTRDQRVMAYATETDGSERYTVRVKVIGGAMLPDQIENGTGDIEWSADGHYLFYTVHDDAWRPYRVYRHALGTPQEKDVLIYEETDRLFSVGLSVSSDWKFIFVSSSSKETDDVLYIPADAPLTEPREILGRKQGREYAAEHREGEFIILTNDEAKDFRIMLAPDGAPHEWRELIPHKETHLIEGVEIFKDFLVVKRRIGGFSKLFIYPKAGEAYQVEFPEPAYAISFGPNLEHEARSVRLVYQSLAIPPMDIEYDMDAHTQVVLKQKEVPGYRPEEYETGEDFATAPDGTRIPITYVRKKGIALPAPVFLEGYGSYGASKDPYFSSARLALLDRGFIHASAHIRGGGELGRSWYETGKYLFKQNTFTDYIACAEHLIAKGYTTSEKLVACGRSAGGLLIGTVLNMRPDLFKAAIADVPFVDVVTTMLDESIPLTVGEFEEWGNPKEEAYYRYMLAYSPYDNVRAQAYPAILVTAGLNDPRVQYWEPAKWVAKLRATKTDSNPILLKTEMEQGHGGASGRYGFLKEIAYEYTFILAALDIA